MLLILNHQAIEVFTLFMSLVQSKRNIMDYELNYK